MTNLLEVSDLRIHFQTDDGLLTAVDGVSFQIGAGEALGLVGESGCGKTVTANSILKLLDSPPARYAGGEIRFLGENLLDLDERAMRRVRGKKIAMVFQEASASLNPLMTIGKQVAEGIIEHERASKRDAREKAIGMLRRVGIPSPEIRFDEYPHQLSGGMKQRAMIAMALACRPELLIADEPTTALDVTIQAQILDLLTELRREFDMALLLITHDLGIVARTCDRVAVMYAGKVVESAPAGEVFVRPRHPYTLGLLRAIPSMAGERKALLQAIPGSLPNPLDLPAGCRFRARCNLAREQCREEPELRELTEAHSAACHFAEEVVAPGEASPAV